MTGGYTKRIGFFIWYSLLWPRDFIRWLKYLTKKDRAIDSCVPWLTWRAIDFLDENIKPGLKVLEWGAGGSTLFFLKKRCRVTSIESSEEWKEFVDRKAYSLSLEQNLDLRFFPAKGIDQESLPPYIQSINDGSPWDVIVVDGIPSVRVECIREAMKNITPDGMLILDDAYWVKLSEVPVILKDWKRVKFTGLGPERRGVSQTDIYFASK